MIHLTEGRRSWDFNHYIMKLDERKIRITIDEFIDEFDIPVGDGDYYIEDSISMPYNPVKFIKVLGADIFIDLFYDDNFDHPFKGMENKISVVKTADNDIELARDKQTEMIKSAFDNEFVNGHFMSTALGIEVDYRRYDKKNDLQNVESLIDFMEDDGVTTTTYKGYEKQTAPATVPKLKALSKEMKKHGVILYNKKDGLLAQIKSLTTIEDIKEVKW